VVLTDLTAEVLTKFRTLREYWNTATNTRLDETATPQDADDNDVVPALLSIVRLTSKLIPQGPSKACPRRMTRQGRKGNVL